VQHFWLANKEKLSSHMRSHTIRNWTGIDFLSVLNVTRLEKPVDYGGSRRHADPALKALGSRKIKQQTYQICTSASAHRPYRENGELWRVTSIPLIVIISLTHWRHWRRQEQLMLSDVAAAAIPRMNLIRIDLNIPNTMQRNRSGRAVHEN